MCWISNLSAYFCQIKIMSFNITGQNSNSLLLSTAYSMCYQFSLAFNARQSQDHTSTTSQKPPIKQMLLLDELQLAFATVSLCSAYQNPVITKWSSTSSMKHDKFILIHREITALLAVTCYLIIHLFPLLIISFN